MWHPVLVGKSKDKDSQKAVQQNKSDKDCPQACVSAMYQAARHNWRNVLAVNFKQTTSVGKAEEANVTANLTNSPITTTRKSKCSYARCFKHMQIKAQRKRKLRYCSVTPYLDICKIIRTIYLPPKVVGLPPSGSLLRNYIPPHPTPVRSIHFFP